MGSSSQGERCCLLSAAADEKCVAFPGAPRVSRKWMDRINALYCTKLFFLTGGPKVYDVTKYLDEHPVSLFFVSLWVVCASAAPHWPRMHQPIDD